MPECLSNEEGNKEYFFDGNGVFEKFFFFEFSAAEQDYSI